MSISRRQFLKIGGGGVAAAVGAGLLGNKLISPEGTVTVASEAEKAGDIEYKHGVCGICELNCAMTGKVEKGRLVKLEGKAADQHSRGSLCAKGNAGINMLYDPDRLKHPLVKTVKERIPGQDPQWKKVSWDEAINEAAAAIRKAIDEHGPQSVLWIGHHFGVDFLNAIGSPNNITHQSTCNNVRQLATQLMLGTGNYVPDFENSKYILCFGWDQPGKAKNSFARGPMHGKNENGAKLVVFDPRLSTTAAKADEWIPVRPGTDLAVILAMINVIITEERYDREFIEQNVFGFEELAAEVEKYTPEWAAEISDVPAETIRRIAIEFSGGCPAVIPIHKREAIQTHPGGFELVRACITMMAITGNIERKGAIMLPRAASINYLKAKNPPPAMQETRRVDGGHLFPLSITAPNVGPGLYQSVPDMILADQPYPIKVAIIYAQSLQSMPNPQKWVKAFEKLDYIININIYPDEMATIADLVLPESCYLEKGEVNVRITNARYPQIAISEPMVKKLFDTKDGDEIKYLIAKKLEVDKYMKPHGEAALNYQLQRYKMTHKQAVEKGALINGVKDFVPRDMTKLNTESGQIQVYSPKLAAMGYHPLPWFDENWVIKPKEKDEFHIVTTRPPTHRHAKTHNMMWLQEITPKGQIWLNTRKGQEMGIATGDKIELTTEYGRGIGEVRLTEGIRPDTICFPHGFGQRSPFLKLSYQNGMNDGDIMPSFNKEVNMAIKDPTGACLDCHMIVKIRKA